MIRRQDEQLVGKVAVNKSIPHVALSQSLIRALAWFSFVFATFHRRRELVLVSLRIRVPVRSLWVMRLFEGNKLSILQGSLDTYHLDSGND